MSLPAPTPGLVIAYSYLWAVEARRGLDAGNKNRPCVIVVSVRRDRGQTIVTVAPITHSPPDRPDGGVVLPMATRVRLGLDDRPSWIITDDLNQFSWPGFDLRTIRRGSDRHDYGIVPASVLKELKAKVLGLIRIGGVDLTSRD